MAAMRQSRLVRDTSAFEHPDLGTVADLARLQLAARRLDFDVVLCNAPVALLELVAFVGLADVLPVELQREPEEREERFRVEEERELDDSAR